MLPQFRYHPDPISTGNIKPSDKICACCGECRGHIYTGPVYSVHELDDAICPWCIADDWKTFVDSYEPGGDPAVYKFICRHCKRKRFGGDYS